MEAKIKELDHYIDTLEGDLDKFEKENISLNVNIILYKKLVKVGKLEILRGLIR